MSRGTIVFLTGAITAAAGAFWWWRQRKAREPETAERGTLIYSNTPPANPMPGVL